MTALEQAQQLISHFGDLISPPREFRGEVTVVVREAERIAEVCEQAKKALGFDFLVDMTSLDHYGEDPRFTVVYHLYNMVQRCHLRLRTDVSEEKSELPSVAGVWRTANWQEREVYDMMGLRFRGHPDLRRILMWEGYPYFPLRKNFPLAGKPSEMPDVAFSKPAPLEGGPFVTLAGGADSIAREPRVRIPQTDALETMARLERRKDVQDAHGHTHGPGPVDPKKLEEEKKAHG
jgi:NADH-quinone oxidoreductase subunit C